MPIKALKNFSFGKLGNKNKKVVSPEGEDHDVEIAEIETKANGKVKDQKKTASKAETPAEGAELIIPLDAPPVRPHGPAAELTLDDTPDDSGIKLDDIDNNDSIKIGKDTKTAPVIEAKIGTVKVKVEVSAPPAAAAAPPAEEKKEEKKDDTDSLNNLFSQDEEEDNPLQSLIDSLPDVSVQELMDDLAEIHRIIKEWRPEAKKM